MRPLVLFTPVLFSRLSAPFLEPRHHSNSALEIVLATSMGPQGTGCHSQAMVVSLHFTWKPPFLTTSQLKLYM